MSENIVNYKNYYIQLQQVETALENDPENEDLQKLHIDLSVKCLFAFIYLASHDEFLLIIHFCLQEVIKLTKELMTPDELALVEDEGSNNSARHNYKPGDYVMAPWSVDGQ